MNKKFNSYVVGFLALCFILIGCSEYSKIVKNDDYDRKIAKAEELYSSGSYNRALVLYEQIYQRYPREDKGELAYYRLGMIYYNMNDYYMSAYYFGNFAGRFPTSSRLEDALYYGALSSVKNSPSISLDQSDTRLAIQDLKFFIDRFPNSRRVDSCNVFIDQMHLKLEQKALQALEMYNRMEKYQATVMSARTFLEEYPNSSEQMRVAYMLLENAYTLATESVFSKKQERLQDVIDIYDQYRPLFDFTKYMVKASEISEKASKELDEVEEFVYYERLLDVYNRSQRAGSKTKKIAYLEDTLKLYYTFAQRFPNSSYMKKAEEIYTRAERERSATYSY